MYSIDENFSDSDVSQISADEDENPIGAVTQSVNIGAGKSGSEENLNPTPVSTQTRSRTVVGDGNSAHTITKSAQSISPIGVGSLNTITNSAQNISPVGVGSNSPNLAPPVANAASANARNNINISRRKLYDDHDEWHSKRLKSVRFHFKGQEKFIYTVKPTTPAEYLQLLIDDKLIDEVVRYTNLKGAALASTPKKVQKGRPVPKRVRAPTAWKELNREEFLQFLGLSLLMGNIQMPTIKHYWKRKSKMYCHPFFGETMPRNRFIEILQALRFYDITAIDVPKVDKIVPIVKHFLENFRKVYSPPKQLAIDEALLGFKGRLSYKQYIPLKRSRFGIKLYELTSSSGYVLDIILYTGKGTVTSSKHGHSYAVVRKLLNGYLNKGHTVYLDNYYTSLSLAEDLYRLGTHITGTLRKNRTGIPAAITKTRLKKGETVFMRRGNLLIQKWYDKREVLMISTRHNGDYQTVESRFGRSKLKPEIVAEYNQCMGGVDRVDQMTSYYSTPRKTIRWYMKLFFHLLDISVWNANYLYNMSNNKKMTYLEFRDEIIQTWIPESGTPKPSSTATSSVDSTSPGWSHHDIKEIKPRARCRYCSHRGKRVMSNYACSVCVDAKGRSVGLCPTCWKTYHDKKLYLRL